MATAEWIRGASFEEVWAQVIDPLLLQALGDPDGSSMAATAAEVLTPWVLQEWTRPGVPIYAVTPPGGLLAPRVRAFVDLLSTFFDPASASP